jgi:2-methylcitrate dehydratase PrpD
MPKLDRRSFLRTATAASFVAASASMPALGTPQTSGANSAAAPAVAPAAPPPVTRMLARYVISAKYEDLPQGVRKEGARTLLNWVGVAVGASHHEGVNDVIAALAPFSGPPQAAIMGRHERFDILNAAMINGISTHIFDYDDTHPKTLIHASSAVVPVALALAEYQPVAGKDFLNAIVLGVETIFRIGNAVFPDHFQHGWHGAGTIGQFGAAVAAGKLLGLNEQQMIWALGLAASQPVGLVESFGSMNKSFNPGRAANNGLLSALLAARNFTSSNQMIEAKLGWANVASSKQDYREITEGLGTRYDAANNTYKPFACGIVLHPIIDAAIQLRNQYKLTADQIERIDMRVNPQVLVLTGQKTPKEGLEGKFSVYHAVAVAIVEGAAGEKQFSQRAVRDPVVVALRSKVVPVVDASIKTNQVDLTIITKDGRKLNKFIQHAVGSIEVPMSDDALEAKVTDLAEGILPATQIRKLMDVCWNVEKLPSAAIIAQAATV